MVLSCTCKIYGASSEFTELSEKKPISPYGISAIITAIILDKTVANNFDRLNDNLYIILRVSGSSPLGSI